MLICSAYTGPSILPILSILSGSARWILQAAKRGHDMRFFDCNCWFGMPPIPPLLPVPTAEDLLAQMDRAGIEQALVWHIAQQTASPPLGNRLLAEAIAPHERLVGCWTLLPPSTHELPPPRELLRQMAQARAYALRAFPGTHRYLLNAVACGELLELMVERRVPLLLSLQRGVGWGEIYDLLADFPDLVCILCEHGCHGDDRSFRPLLARYPGVYVDISHYLLDGGLEALVAEVGAQRILYGSGFPEVHMGGMMLALRHAQIPEEAKAAIAAGNLERILAEVQR
ncbi:MAG: amidohydrolase family protein [Anaerolineae bacterium]